MLDIWWYNIWNIDWYCLVFFNCVYKDDIYWPNIFVILWQVSHWHHFEEYWWAYVHHDDQSTENFCALMMNSLLAYFQTVWLLCRRNGCLMSYKGRSYTMKVKYLGTCSKTHISSWYCCLMINKILYSWVLSSRLNCWCLYHCLDGISMGWRVATWFWKKHWQLLAKHQVLNLYVLPVLGGSNASILLSCSILDLDNCTGQCSILNK